jgi:hypothetical protein
MVAVPFRPGMARNFVESRGASALVWGDGGAAGLPAARAMKTPAHRCRSSSVTSPSRGSAEVLGGGAWVLGLPG